MIILDREKELNNKIDLCQNVYFFCIHHVKLIGSGIKGKCPLMIIINIFKEMVYFTTF